jgi:hypothetical protein
MTASAGLRLLAAAGLAVAAAAAACPPGAESTPGAAILAYLHGRGEALDIATPQPLKVTYIDWRNVNWDQPQVRVVLAHVGAARRAILNEGASC